MANPKPASDEAVESRSMRMLTRNIPDLAIKLSRVYEFD